MKNVIMRRTYFATRLAQLGTVVRLARQDIVAVNKTISGTPGHENAS
jgi:hypothetical protein